MTKIIKVENINEISKIDEASEALKRGELVAFPTETVYGIGGNAYLKESANNIFKVKGRPSDNPLIVHIADVENAKEIGKNIPEVFYKLAEKFWPGPLTMIVEKSDKIPDSVSANLKTVGIRIPANPYSRYLIEKAGCPVAAPSANKSGKVSATKARYVYDDFKDEIPYIIDGGDCEVGIESTVINLTTKPYMVLRPGKITIDELREVDSDFVLHPSLKNVEEVVNPASPGMKYKHYSPDCPVVLVMGSLKSAEDYILKNADSDDAIFAFHEQGRLLKREDTYYLGSVNDLSFCMNKIFNYLRDADNKKAKKIYLTGVKEEGIGLALMNRLKKTSGENKVKLREILFICTGNTCRSPMAEYILKSYNIENMYVKSRGLYVCCASGMAFSSEAILDKHDIPYDKFTSCQVSEDDIINADEIYTMTNKQRESLISFFPQFKDKINTLIEGKDVADPYMQPEYVYEETFREINDAIFKRFYEKNI